LIRNKSGSLVVAIIIFLLHLLIPVGINPVETNEALPIKEEKPTSEKKRVGARRLPQCCNPCVDGVADVVVKASALAHEQ
jgi:hypothetical protein